MTEDRRDDFSRTLMRFLRFLLPLSPSCHLQAHKFIVDIMYELKERPVILH